MDNGQLARLTFGREKQGDYPRARVTLDPPRVEQAIIATLVALHDDSVEKRDLLRVRDALQGARWYRQAFEASGKGEPLPEVSSAMKQVTPNVGLRGFDYEYAEDYLREEEGKYSVAEKKDTILVGPDEGAYLPVLDIVHKVPSESFGGALTIVEWGLPPGVMIPPHTHSREHECNYVLKGELTCDVGGEIVVASVGSYVVKPRGVYHALCNVGTEPVWVIEIHAPGGFESWYNEYEEIASKLASGEIDEDEHRRARAELSERYGVTFHDERIPEARARCGIGP